MITWNTTPIVVIGLLCSGAAAVAAMLAWRRRSAPGGLYFSLLMVAIAEYGLAAAMEANSSTIATKVFWSKMEYLGFPSSAVLLLMFALSYSLQGQSIARRWIVALWTATLAINLVAWTNEWHGLLWSSLTMAPGGNNVLIYGHGPAYFVYAAYCTALLLASSLVFIRTAARMGSLYRLQVGAVIASMLPVWVLGTLYSVAPGLVGGLDVTPIGLLITSLLLAWTLMQLRIFDLVPVAHGALLNGMVDGVVVLDARKRIVEANPAAVRLLGLTGPRLAGEQAEAALAAYPELVGDLDSKREIQIRRIDGSVSRFLDVRISPLHTSHGDSAGHLIVLRDVTDQRALEEELLRAQRLEMAGRIAAQVSHDFNNLLGPMIAYPEIIKMSLPADHPAVPYCDTMLDAAQQMAKINEDMMVVGRRGHFHQEPIDVNDVVRRALSQVAPVPAGLKLRTELRLDLPPVSASMPQLLRVIGNLVSNARESMADAGLITIRTEGVHLDRPLHRYGRIERGEYVRLAVSDNGCGIPEEIQGRIFDAFFTTKPKRRRGAGLGLAIVQSIVGDHSGYVDLESRPGQGTTFYVYLPVCRGRVEATLDAPVPGGTETVLVVDDDHLQRDAATLTLQSLGYRVHSVESGEAAVEFVRTNHVDLVILDMLMPPGMDGLETYQRIAEARPGQRAIIVSGFAESDRVQQAQALGAGAYLRKPTTREKLASAVRLELGRAPGPNRN